MSQILQNLIDRQQTTDLSRFVQPRPRARFEDKDISGTSTQIDEAEAASPGIPSPPRQDSPAQAAAPSSQMADNFARTHRPTTDHTPPLTARPAAHHPMTDTVDRPQPQAPHQPPQKQAATDTTPADPAGLTVTNQLTPRVTSVLQSRRQHTTPAGRLATGVTPASDDQSVPETIHAPNTPAQDTPRPATSLPPQADMASAIEPDRPPAHPLDAPSTTEALLQTPDWLTEIQAKLQGRGQAATSDPEPVVNVTIGRIEIKATPAPTPATPRAAQKPGGIMSLADYLRQRNGERP